MKNPPPKEEPKKRHALRYNGARIYCLKCGKILTPETQDGPCDGKGPND